MLTSIVANSRVRALLLLMTASFGVFIAVGLSVSVLPSCFPDAGVTLISTEDQYRTRNNLLFGRYKHIRSQLDYSFHAFYTKERVAFQDALVDEMLQNEEIKTRKPAGHNCSRSSLVERPWIVFTAGAMGAGKSHTMKLLHEKARFPLDSFVVVDPDQIRQNLPEFPRFVKSVPDHAGRLTRKESGMIAEIMVGAALKNGHNVLVDGSLRDPVWYRNYFGILRHSHPSLRIAILHITAARENVFKNARHRAEVTGRVVPTDLLELSMEQVPKSVALLRPLVDFAVEINNTGTEDVDIVTENVDWDVFKSQWAQPC